MNATRLSALLFAFVLALGFYITGHPLDRYEQDLRRFTLGDAHATERDVLVDQKYGRLRSVTAAPDGSLLVTTSTGSGDRIVRIAPTR